MRQRTCKRCNQPCEAGVHFNIHPVLAGVSQPEPVMAYDICQACWQQRSPLILPGAGLQKAGVQVQYDVRFESFDDREQKEATQA